MTTAQESTNGHLPQKGYPQDALFAGHKVFPTPFSVENPAELNSADLPTNKANITDDAISIVIPSDEPERGISPDPSQSQVAPPKSQISHLSSPDSPPFPANAYHVPPTRYAPKANSYRYDDFPSAEIDTTPLPERCQFMFSDGRQCTMARSDIHPSLCRFHAEREDQLFGSPVSGGSVVGAAFDLPELHSACRDLTTAAGVSRALAQVFRLFAQRRISRQEAATFAKLAHLLLQSIRAARAESMIQSEEPLDDPLTLEESLRDTARSRLPRRPSTEAVIPKTTRPISGPTFADRAETTIRPGSSSRATNWSEGPLPASALADESDNVSASLLDNGRGGEDEESRAGSPTHAPARATPARLNEVACVGVQSSASVRNTPKINTSKNTQLNPIQNQHLHKMYTEGGSCSSGRPAGLP